MIQQSFYWTAFPVGVTLFITIMAMSSVNFLPRAMATLESPLACKFYDNPTWWTDWHTSATFPGALLLTWLESHEILLRKSCASHFRGCEWVQSTPYIRWWGEASRWETVGGVCGAAWKLSSCNSSFTSAKLDQKAFWYFEMDVQLLS